MGCRSSIFSDVGYSWWYLADKENWQGVERLVRHKPETCQQVQPETSSLLLHRLCERESVPTALIRKVAEAYPDALWAPDQSGRLPLHLACQRVASEEVIQLLARPESCRAADNEGLLPLHVLCQSMNRPGHEISVQAVNTIVQAHEAAAATALPVRKEVISCIIGLDRFSKTSQCLLFHLITLYTSRSAFG
jgi:hypothetical protein